MIRARKNTGRISFVGAGPGDPGLLTAWATELCARADLIVVDQTIPPVLRTVVAGAGQIQEASNDAAETAKMMLTPARAGQTVVRLVAGDPMSSEGAIAEALAVSKANVPFDVVPGISNGVGAATYAGVPTGPVRLEVDARGEVDWAAIAATPGTVILTAKAAELGKVAASLIEHGRPGNTPACVTTMGSLVGQRSLMTTIEAMEAQAVGFLESVAQASLPSPDQPENIAQLDTVVVSVGETISRQPKLSWWESRPLYAWKVLVPRTKEQAGVMSERLSLYGAVPSEVPTIAVEPPRTPAQMERAIKGLVTGRYEWIVFTSTNAVKAVREKFTEFGLDARAFAGVKIACIGESTAQAVRDFGITPELVPTGEQSSEGLLAEFAPYDRVLDPIDRILLPRADIATETLSAGLSELKWEIDDVTAYRTVRAAPPPAPMREAIKGGGFDAVCFTSSSTVRNLVGIAGKPHARTIVACIGPQTAATAREFGLRVDVQPEVAEVGALVDALAAYGAEHQLEIGPLRAPARKTRSRGRAAQ